MSNKLIALKKWAENLSELEVKIYRKWAHAFCMLPFYHMSHTAIKQLEDDYLDIRYEDPITSGYTELMYVILVLDKKPDKGGDLSLVGCTFEQNNRAFIEKKEECYQRRKFPELDAIDFFGFTGTWDEVGHKMFVANKVLSLRNPFTRVPKM